MKANFLLLLFGIVTMAFVGCVKDPHADPPKPAPDTVPIVKLKLSEVSVMSSAIKFKVESSVATQPYLCLGVSKAYAEGKSDKVLIGELMADMKKQADAKSMDLRAFIASVANVGNKEITIQNLAPTTEYTVIAFGVNGITPGTEIARLTFETLGANMIDCKFAIGFTINGNNVKFNIQPSDKETEWYFCTMPKEFYDFMTTENKWDAIQMLSACFVNEADGLLALDLTDEQVYSALLRKGDVELEAKGLEVETEYICLTIAVKRVDKGIELVSSIARDSYTTGKAAPSDMTFKITVDNISKIKAHIKLEPSNLIEEYLFLCSNYTAENKDLTPVEMMNNYYKGLGSMASIAVISGGRDFKEYAVSAGLDYFILAFGYASGPTTEPEIVKFSTPAGQDPAQATIDIMVDGVNPFGADLTFTPSDESVYYAFGLAKAGTIEKDSLIISFDKGVADYLKQQQEIFGVVRTTMASVIQGGYFNDEVSYTFIDMEPNTVYDAFTLTISMDGKVAAFKEHPAILKTPSISTTTVSATVLGYFDGDIEAGTVFGDARATAGRAIVAIQYTPSSDDAISIAASTIQDNSSLDELDPNVISDKELREYIQWNEFTPKAPYQFVLAQWNVALCSFAYIKTADGSFGNISRKAVEAPNKESVGTIEQLQAIFDAVPADGKAKTVKSMSEIAPIQRKVNTPIVRRKGGFSIMDQYISSMTTKKQVNVKAPYSLEATNDLPISRIAK